MNRESTSEIEPTPRTIPLRLRFFGAACELTGCAEAAFSVTAGATVREAFVALSGRYPELANRFGVALLIALNQEYVPLTTVLSAHDELAIFPPVSGGSAHMDAVHVAHDFFELTIEPIDVGGVARRFVPTACGATVTLDGYVREWTRGRQTLYLVYEAYPEMALKEMARLVQQAHAEFEISQVGIVHRTGRLEIGETSVVISVAAPHRIAAFKCCEWLIRELKRTVPIWKKEYYAGGAAWAEGEHGEEDLTQRHEEIKREEE
jgi:MoaE-MoaD fusion protein